MELTCVLGKLICVLGFLFLATVRYGEYVLMGLRDFSKSIPILASLKRLRHC